VYIARVTQIERDCALGAYLQRGNLLRKEVTIKPWTIYLYIYMCVCVCVCVCVRACVWWGGAGKLEM
jgi:hypothetical protein